MLENNDIREVAVMGLATDYCVKFTALDAARLGLKTCLIEDGCRGVDLNSGDVQRAVEEMRNAGIAIVKSDQIKNQQSMAAPAETKDS